MGVLSLGVVLFFVKKHKLSNTMLGLKLEKLFF